MKHTPARIFMTLLAFGLAFTHMSCSSNLSELTGSVSLEIPQSIVSRASTENTGSSELYVVAMAKGDDYTAAQYKTIREGSLSSDDRFMKLLDIPTDKNIRIDMAVIDNQGVRKYYGSTGTFYVQHGINVQNIRLTRINEGPGAALNYESKSGFVTYNGYPTVIDDANGGGSIYFFSDGWYTIQNSASLTLSAGTWEGSTSGIVHLTENIYKEINPEIKTNIFNSDDQYVNPFPNIIITKEPKKYDINFFYDGATMFFSFTLRNGLQIQLNLGT